MDRLIGAIQDLSLARHLDDVAAVVRSAARDLVGADGATFVLREGEHCYYKDEDAIEPLWKGRKFPLELCVSGWAMLNREPAVIPDIYADERVPDEVYRPTFVKSLVMVPIRTRAPIGAIGTYWARPYRANAAEVQMLQALADSTSVALENVQVYAELEERVRQRTEELAAANGRLRAEVAERERAQAAVHQIAITDDLTGIYNRRGFRMLAERELALARRLGIPSMLISVDVDFLKLTNDRFGHAAGDQLIIDTARLLTRVFRATDIVARLGGDEFAVLCPSSAREAGSTDGRSDGGAEALQRLRHGLLDFNLAARGLQPLSLSLGATVIPPDDGRDLDHLLAAADRAMYADKQGRRGPLSMVS
ncbi:diguanylate cyclase (GGDEF)-like protein [Dongia mobilis]|uniref:diguanylate cyclase n=1 Tax=Dongia mobilis TaxID=578943 RepID=A0A4V3DF57_9PROT|nr:sensor domain-containing diguanylate cyclase [Dongia mobilis]TDQ86325.1 diguanylate cyclase (GGDEF)-like protein [Dongia mobilis]